MGSTRPSHRSTGARSHPPLIPIAVTTQHDVMSNKLALVNLLAMFVLVVMALGAEARCLPTRSDPLAPVGPPRGEDPRFDRLYDVVKELLRAAEPFEDNKFDLKQPIYEGGRF